MAEQALDRAFPGLNWARGKCVYWHWEEIIKPLSAPEISRKTSQVWAKPRGWDPFAGKSGAAVSGKAHFFLLLLSQDLKPPRVETMLATLTVLLIMNVPGWSSTLVLDERWVGGLEKHQRAYQRRLAADNRDLATRCVFCLRFQALVEGPATCGLRSVFG